MFCLRILINMTNWAKIRALFFFQKRVTLVDRKRLKSFLSKILERECHKTSGEVRVIFCSDEFLLQINKQYLNHDYYTDIITFPYSNESDDMIDAELYISVDRISENAKQLKTSIKTELHRVIFHGVLHLCGYGDKTKQEIERIRKKEDDLLSKYFLRST